MTVWKISYYCGENTHVTWAKTRNEAKKKLQDRLRSLRLDEDSACPSIELKNIPTDRNGLLRWLNKNYVSTFDDIV
jgi:hypothetical protein